ncbi:hypothetical protein BHE74_00009990 [Ensete ventricosum]|nr:hypothetical protein BHE74_00009990 [Ensete ventricosum]RZR82435.1 hypothetical protein BHM03_00008845 [Ensete ventricosum]
MACFASSVKALNQARLEATVRAYGSAEITKKWPSPYILACGVLLVVSLFKRFFHPLRWFAIAAVLVGINPIILRGIAAIRRLTLDINILLLIAGTAIPLSFRMFKMEVIMCLLTVGGAVALRDYSEAAFVVFLFTIAEWLESRASHKATAGMSSLMSMAPQKAVVAETGQIVDIEDVKINAIIAVKAGEVIPIDGIVQFIGKLKSREGSTAMVGDGMNDAPALAMADVGISMGVSGSAVAMETSHITLMSNDICKIPRAIRLARKTRRMIIMNIIFSGVTKIAILAIAFAGHPLLWAAVLADVGTCLLVILNSMTLLQTKTSPKKECCGSSHKAHMEKKPKHAEHCGCQDNHGCHDHRKAMDERRHSHCLNHDHPEESPAHAHCCQELATEPTNSTQEHLITIADASHDSGDLQKQQDGPDSNMTCENQTLKCSSNNCNDKEKKRVEECCIGNRNDCGMRQGCSSSQGLIVERRELGGCCRSYTKACGSKDSCCDSGRVQLPEIITE